jgi:putative oxidoreductase
MTNAAGTNIPRSSFWIDWHNCEREDDVERVVSWRVATLSDWSIVPLRIVVGVGFIAHGLAKWQRGPDAFAHLLTVIGVPYPIVSAWLVTLLETFGGLAVLLGVGIAVISVPLIASMLVAMFSLHIHYGFSSVNTIGLTTKGPIFGPPGYEINLLYVAALGVLALSGPGPLSVQRLWARSRTEGAP